MIVCYSKKLKQRVAVDHYINVGVGSGHYLIAFGKSPIFTFVLIKADNLNAAYDKYCASDISQATKLSLDELNKNYMQKGRKLMQGAVLDFKAILADIDSMIMRSNVCEVDIIAQLEDIIEYTNEVISEIKKAAEWDSTGPYNNDVLWLKEHKEPHRSCFIIEESIPNNQIEYVEQDRPKVFLGDTPYPSDNPPFEYRKNVPPDIKLVKLN